MIWNVNAWEPSDDCFNKTFMAFILIIIMDIIIRYEDGRALFAFDTSCLVCSGGPSE